MSEWDLRVRDDSGVVYVARHRQTKGAYVLRCEPVVLLDHGLTKASITCLQCIGLKC